MAIEREIIITADTSDADAKFDKLAKSLKKVDKTADDVSKNASKSTANLGKASETATKKVNVLSNGFKTLGTAIKATGIGLLVSLVATLGQGFSSNQRFLDMFSTAFETLAIFSSQLVNALFNVYDSVSANSKNFDALGKVLGGLLTLGITPLKLGFFAIKGAILTAQLAWEKSFFGDKNQNTIKQLNKDIAETKDAFLETGKEAVKAGVDIVTNFGEAVTETMEIGKSVINEVSKLSISSAYETAKSNVAIKNSALLAVAEQGRLVEVFDRQAEKQRQIRDDETKSLEVRKKANEELGKVLEKQEKAMLKQADAQIASANAEYQKNKTIEAQVALIDAQANREGVLAQIEGFRSEQQQNANSLLKEENDLINLQSASIRERAIAQKDFNATQEKDPLKKIELERQSLVLQNQLIKDDLKIKRELYAEGTAMRVEAEQEYLTRKQEIDNALIENSNKTAEETIKTEQMVADAKKEIQDATLDNISGGIGLLKSLGEKSKGIQKASLIAESAVGIAKIIQNTQTANAIALASPINLADPTYGARTSLLNKISAGIGIATNLVATAKGLQALGGGSAGGSGSDTGGSGGNAPQAPSFNLIQGTGRNQIAESLQGERPLRAFVVAKDVTTGQSLDRNILNSASI